MRLTIVGLGIIVAVSMLSHGWRELGTSSGGAQEELHSAAAVLVLAGSVMGFGAIMTIWNPRGTFIVPGLAALLAIIAGSNGIPSAFAYGAVAALLCALTVVDGNRDGRASR